MARNILCKDCDTKLNALAEYYDELYESIGGEAKKDFKCDDCDKEILEGQFCFASVLLPSKNHPNCSIQKPSAWKDDYITEVIASQNKNYGTDCNSKQNIQSEE